MDVPILKKAIEAALFEQIVSDAGEKIGYPDLKDEQRKAVAAFIQGKDVFVSLPTGSGKSLCFALLPLLSTC